MNAKDFAFWLQGFVEMNPNAMPTLTQWQTIKDHLKLVFDKRTPNNFNTLEGLHGIPVEVPSHKRIEKLTELFDALHPEHLRTTVTC